MPRRSSSTQSRTWIIGSSVAGPRHRRTGTRNQDAWRSVHTKHGTAVVVADGVGSARFASEGSRLACAAAVTVFKSLHQTATPSEVAEAVSSKWKSGIQGSNPSDFATTLLLAYRFSTGRLLVGGIGDGLIAVCSKGAADAYRVVDRPGGDFGETFAISSRSALQHWRFEEFDDADSDYGVLLATDGVSNDLLEPRVPALIQYLRIRFERSNCMKWRRGLRKMLLDWPTPGSTDDKTIAMMWRSRGKTT